MNKRLALALFALNVSLSFSNVWPTPWIRWAGAISPELAFLVLGLMLVTRGGRQISRGLLTGLTALWLLLILGRYVTVTAPALWGRELNFYWDLHFLPDVFAMLAAAAKRAVVVVIATGAVLVAAVVVFAIRWSIRQVSGAVARPMPRLVLAVTSVVIVVLWLIQTAGLWPSSLPRFPEPVTAAYARQARFLINAVGGRATLPASPSFASGFSRVAGADVLLFFIESYGAVTFEEPALARPLERPRARLDAAIAASGRHVISAFVRSPTFGGSSWFAHITLMSGLQITDPDANALLMTERRPTLPRVMAEHGYRSVAMMPGLWYPWPEGAFYGFDEIYNGERLGYKGPPFGWWSMTDQFVLAALDARERNRPGRPPLFVFFPTISTHTPFAPTPPYQPDWSRMTTPHPYDDDVLERAYEHEVDWMNLRPSYVAAMSYSYETLAGYLSQPADRDAVIILIGDHQPPALVSGEGASWDVPVHVITNRPAILDRLASHGFRPGITPSRPSLGPMNELLPTLLDAF